MTKLVQGVLTVVQGLSRRERRDLVQGMFEAGLLSEDEQDRVTIKARRKDRTRPLSCFLKSHSDESPLKRAKKLEKRQLDAQLTNRKRLA